MVLCGAAAAFPVRAQYGFPSFADLAEKLIPTVVNISTIQQPDQINIPADGSNGGGEYYDPLEGRVALGSGFIISEDGYIITNYHVIENAEVVNVVLFDNTEVEADIIGGDSDFPLKPEPDALFALMRKHNVPPEQCWMFGDHYTDLEAARRAGCHRALARYGFGEPREEKFEFEVGSFPEFVMAIKGF